jgi:hypothetical protein
MSFSYSWDASFEALPDNNTYGYLIDDYFRIGWVAIRERMEIDHVWKVGATDGRHNKLTLTKQTVDPTPEAYHGYFYCKDLTLDVMELFWQDSKANVYQLTDSGLFHADMIPYAAILQRVYPIGCIYITIDPTNPATTFGFGTWVAFGSGKVPVGVDGAQTEFNTVEKTGGEKTHQLTTTEMPSHVHSLPMSTIGGAGAYVSVAQNVATAPTNTGSIGSDGAHNNLQPYITCYMWKRTA